MNAAQVRIGDAEREAAAHDLGEHFAFGRISAEEHAERLDQVWSARTAADLAPVFADLPRLREPQAGPRAGGVRRAGWAAWMRDSLSPVPFVFKVLLAIVVAAVVVAHLPLLVVALLVYVFCLRRVGRRRHHWR